MIFKLVYKSLSAHWRILGFFILAGLFVANFFTILGRELTWIPYISISSAQIILVVCIFFLLEKNRKGDILSFFLPVTRCQIVTGKFFSAVLLSMACLFLWTVNAFCLYRLSGSPPSEFLFFQNPVFLVLLSMLFVLFIDIFMPFIVSLDAVWSFLIVGLGGLAFFAIGMSQVLKYFHRSFSTPWQPGFKVVAVFAVFLVLCSFVSLRLSFYLSTRNEVVD